MNRAALYQCVNKLQRRDAKEIIDEFAPLMRWRAEGHDSLVDVGCGIGDVTVEYVRPILPANYSRLVGFDISDQMLRFARKRFGHMQISFDKVDIGGDLTEYYFDGWKPVDHITSFYCLHWVPNQKKAIENIRDLLTPDGDCLLMFLAAHTFFDVYAQMSKMSKWAVYMPDVDRFISPYQWSADAVDEFKSILKSSGFADYRVDVRNRLFTYEGIDVLKRSAAAVNPFIDRIPVEKQNDFLDDFVSALAAIDAGANTLDCRIFTPYKLLVAYARK